MGVTPPQPKQILNTGDLVRLQDIAANNFVHHALVDYVVRVVMATRYPEQLGMNDVKSWISFGASPRASLGIIAGARSLALVRGRDYVIPQDIVEVIPDVLRHRLVLTYDALADEISPEIVINRVLQTVGMPQVNAVPQQGHSVPPAMQAAARLAVGDGTQSAGGGPPAVDAARADRRPEAVGGAAHPRAHRQAQARRRPAR